MGKYLYYIVDTTDGTVAGTDDENLAKETAESEDYFVIDPTKGNWFQPDGKVEGIRETTLTREEEEEEDEDEDDDEDEG